ncbi:MAG: hypothetical protein VYD08_08260, partial [Pseudomonadota bacterium]|nr:hypothetical protein [Pseudomonadota bacterium]
PTKLPNTCLWLLLNLSGASWLKLRKNSAVFMLLLELKHSSFEGLYRGTFSTPHPLVDAIVSNFCFISL